MPSNTPQGMLYQMRGQNTTPSDGNGSRNRVAEQQNSAASGNPYNYRGNSNMDWNQFLNGQDQSLGRYTPPTLQGTSPTDQRWNNNQGGYAYNLPTSFGGFGGFSQYSQGQGITPAINPNRMTPQQPPVRQSPATDVGGDQPLPVQPPAQPQYGRFWEMLQAARRGRPNIPGNTIDLPNQPSMQSKPMEYRPPVNGQRQTPILGEYTAPPQDRVRRFLSSAANPNIGLPVQPYTPPEYM